jgi:hypothetical protein
MIQSSAVLLYAIPTITSRPPGASNRIRLSTASSKGAWCTTATALTKSYLPSGRAVPSR